jgi:peroxiredoxin
MDRLHTLPPDLPVPVDDGACGHLFGAVVPSVSLWSTGGRQVDLAEVARGRAVLFFFPRTGRPDEPAPAGWDAIPGARGCTPQSCAFRDAYHEFRALGVSVYGVSTQTTEHQDEFARRTALPYELLSDQNLELTRALRLPTFEFPVRSGGPDTLIKRLALFVAGGRIRRVWYPVFPPDRNAADVLAWLRGEGVAVRPIRPNDKAWVQETLLFHWGSTVIRSIDVPYQADELPGFIAEDGGEPVGLVACFLAAGQCEVITLSSNSEDRGVGSALLQAAVDAAEAAGCSRIFLTTTNDNLRALGFYQKRGWRLVTVHRGAMDRSRAIKPDIPTVGHHGIPLHDEIEMELRIDGTQR